MTQVFLSYFILSQASKHFILSLSFLENVFSRVIKDSYLCVYPLSHSRADHRKNGYISYSLQNSNHSQLELRDPLRSSGGGSSAYRTVKCDRPKKLAPKALDHSLSVSVSDLTRISVRFCFFTPCQNRGRGFLLFPLLSRCLSGASHRLIEDTRKKDRGRHGEKQEQEISKGPAPGSHL